MHSVQDSDPVPGFNARIIMSVPSPDRNSRACRRFTLTRATHGIAHEIDHRDHDPTSRGVDVEHSPNHRLLGCQPGSSMTNR